MSAVNMSLSSTFAQKTLLKQCKSLAESYSKEVKEEWLMAFKTKPQYGMLFNHLEQEEIDNKRSFDWVNRCHMSPLVESYIFAAQELALFTKYHEAFILKNSQDKKCSVLERG